MDPLSISISVLTVATVAGQVGAAFSKLREDCLELPGRLHALNNEVADIKVVLRQVATLLKERDQLSATDTEAIPPLLAQANARLLELSSAVDSLAETAGGRIKLISRTRAWRKWQPRLQNLQTELRDVKCSLNILLGASNSRDMIRVRLDLESLYRTSSNESDEQTTFRDNFPTQLAQQQAALTSTVDGSMQKVDERVSNIEHLLIAQAAKLDQFTASDRMPTMKDSSMVRQRRKNARPLPENMMVSNKAVGVRVNTQFGPGCRVGCPCSCHSETKSTTSEYFDRIVGRLFLGYAGLPLVNARCDSTACARHQNPQVSAEYWFPIGFLWSQIVRIELAYHPNLGPQWSLTALRRVPDSATCVKYSLEGNIDGLKSLFRQGLASPKDVSSTRGYTLLRWALYGQQYETCRFLVAAGSDPEYKPLSKSDDSPADKACDVLLRGNLAPEVVEILRYVSRASDWIDDQNFAPMHKIVLGLSLRDLKTEIVDCRDIDIRDAMGRTALEWASARGDESFVVILLSHGADPSIMDKKLNTPLTLAANQGHTACVRLLVEAGAPADPVLPPGIKFGSPLNCATRNASDPLLLKTLLDFDADVEACGVDGVVPLLHAARGKPSSFAKLLLDYGANINATSKNEHTPLTTSIVHNNHGVLRLLLDRWFEYTECPRLKGPHLLDLVAKHADIETMSILARAKHLKLCRDDRYASNEFWKALTSRVDVHDDVIDAFEHLLDSMRNASEPSASRTASRTSHLTDKDLEMGHESPEDVSSDTEDEDWEDASESLRLAGHDLSIRPSALVAS